MSAAAPDIRRAGDRALLVDVGSLESAMAWHAELQSDPLAGQLEVVGAARTVLVRFASAAAAEAAVASLRGLAPAHTAPSAAREHVLDVVYDGDDLAETARLLGMSSDALVEAHTATVWRAAFGGFAPGFAYCAAVSGPAAEAEGSSAAHPLWDVPRLTEPRTAVPAGAVGLAGPFSAVYPRRSPGGWRLIGRTDALLWDGDSEHPALLAPGDLVRYRAVRAPARAAAAESDRSTAAESDRSAEGEGPSARAPSEAHEDDERPTRADPAATRTVLRVDDAGLLTLIEDAGRPGHGDLGVSPSGAADTASAEAANAAVGNAPGAPVLEIVGAARFTCLADAAVAVTGAAGGTIVAAQLLRAGDALALEPAPDLARSYLAVRGGATAPHEVGSASADVLAGLGPAPLLAGAEVSVPVRAPAASAGHATENPARIRRDEQAAAAPRTEGTVVLRAVAGPRDDWFPDRERDRFSRVRWVVGEKSNRVGTRLEAADGAAPLTRSREGELPSEGTVTGAVQVPPNGAPVVFGPDRPVTGGYPVIATVVTDDLDLLAQLPPGASVRFVLVDPHG